MQPVCRFSSEEMKYICEACFHPQMDLKKWWQDMAVAGCNGLCEDGEHIYFEQIREITDRLKGDIAFPLVAVLRFAILHLAMVLRTCNS